MPSWAANLLESLGLTLLLLSVTIGLLSLWSGTATEHPLAQRLAQRLAVLPPKILTYLTLLLMFSGVALLVLSLLLAPAITPQPPPLPSPPPPRSLPVDPAPEKPAVLPVSPVIAQPASLPAPVSEPVVTPVVPTIPTPRAQPLPAPAPAAVPQQTASTQLSRPKERPPERKAHIFNARCSRLLEKVGAGEPMSETEHNEMVTQCQ